MKSITDLYSCHADSQANERGGIIPPSTLSHLLVPVNYIILFSLRSYRDNLGTTLEQLWNNFGTTLEQLPVNIHHAESSDIFKSLVKTHLFV